MSARDARVRLLTNQAFTEEFALALHRELLIKAEVIERLSTARDYAGALEEISAFAPLLQEFFTDVLVMADQEDLRAMNLGLLSRVFI